MRRRSVPALMASLFLAGCAVARFDLPGASNEAAYAAAHPYYAEYCALSQIKKKVGFGADIRGEIGGHAVFYLNGACRIEDAGYPVLKVCTPAQDGSGGVGLSMNAHFRNAKWVATPGRDFFFNGGLDPNSTLTQAAYRSVTHQAQRLGIYDGVTFNDWVFTDKPAGWSNEDWRYEVSAATDYAIGMGRGRYCARVPVTPAQMARMVDFLNRENAPYREGRRTFEWSVFNDNCIHLAHNALAEAGIWTHWPIERILPIAIFDFPVPRNEFVNIMRRTNDAWPESPATLYADLPGRDELLRYGRLPTFPGALAEAQPPMQANQVYDLDLKLIFMDEPTFGHFQHNFDAIFANPRYLDAAANRDHFAALARTAAASRRPLAWWLAQAPYKDDPAGFSAVYAAYYRAVDALMR